MIDTLITAFLLTFPLWALLAGMLLAILAIDGIN